MSAALSPATSQNYGVQRVCRIWGLPRSSFYHAILRVRWYTPRYAVARCRRWRRTVC